MVPLSEVGLCGFFCRDSGGEKREMTSAGETRTKLRVIGIDEHNVIASSIAPTFRRKSATKTAGL